VSALFATLVHVLLTPLQYWHVPQRSPFDIISAGHDVDAPVHVSNGSHAPPDALHTVPAFPAG